MRPSTRRELIASGAAGAALLAANPAWATRQLSGRAGIGRGTFNDGVASGEPSATAVTFWSRLTTDRPRSGARLIVAKDAGMRHVVATHVVPTGRATNGTLKKRVGKLKPHTQYYYVWESGNDVSDIGRTRTLLPPGSRQPLNIAFSSCQSWPSGYFTPHAHAAQQDIDLYVFLGDYIYEVKVPGTAPGQVRRDPIDSNDLRSYRRKYELYRTDAGLRELHRLQPTVHVWDDHEVANNYTDNHPAPSAMQRYAAYRVAMEWVPHVNYKNERFRIFKRIQLNRTVDLFLLDTRQYRTVDDAGNPVRILGEREMNWIIAGLKASRATWKIIAQQVVVAPMDFGNGEGTDSWGGYGNSRTQLLGEIERAGIPNVVFLTGDAHVFMVNLLASDIEALRSDPNHHPAAIEYVGGSVTSLGGIRDENDVRARNPWNREYNGAEHGYAHMALDDAQLVTEYRRSDLLRPDGLTSTFERFTQPAGSNTIGRESFPPT